MQVYEIHKYRGDSLLYIVARTNKHSEDYVRSDVEKMNNLLTPEMKGEGIRYVLTLGSIESLNKRTGDRPKKKDKQSATDENTTSS